LKSLKNTLIISDENFSGSGFESFYKNKHKIDSYLLLKRLGLIFQKVKVLYIVREQRAWLKSLYKQQISRGYNLSYPQFIESVLKPYSGIAQAFYLGHLKQKTEKQGISLLILPFEHLQTRPQLFIEHLNQFFQCEFPKLPHENKAIQNPKESLIKNLQEPNGLGLHTPLIDFRKAQSWFQSRLHKDDVDIFELPKTLQNTLRLHIQAGNRHLQQHVDWDLQSLGYLI